MKCSKCEKEIEASAKFCNHCGSIIEILGKTCINTQCGRTDLPEEAVFCPDCGTKLVTYNPEVSEVKPKEEDTLKGSSGRFVDPRDGHEYKWIRIGTQIWMAENLAYKVGKGCWVYDKEKENVLDYGYLYNWDTSFAACPTGWHLPSIEEWEILRNYLIENGYQYKDKVGAIAKALAAIGGWKDWYQKGTIGWKMEKNNTSGFNGKAGGYRFGKDKYAYKNEDGYWWSSSIKNEYSKEAMHVTLTYNERELEVISGEMKEGYSVRCIKD